MGRSIGSGRQVSGRPASVGRRSSRAPIRRPPLLPWPWGLLQGWSLRSFAAPQQWGDGSRAEKLRAKPEFKDPPSDGHQSGLALIVLREAGVSAQDPRILRGVRWLLTNQRESGRWWTRSLNTDTFHFITYSGTLYPLVALDLCGARPGLQPVESISSQAQK